MNAAKIRYFAGRKNQSGATLIVIIISLLVLTVIGVAIYALTSTALLNQTAAQSAARAFYIAESGIRIAASEYKVALSQSTTVADNTLANLNNQTFPIPNNPGQVNVKIELYPYWFRANSTYTANNTTLTLYLPGAVPPIDDTGTTAITFPANVTSPGLLKYKNGTTVGSYSAAAKGTFNAASGGTPVTFTLSTPFPHVINSGDEFYLGYGYNSTATPAAAGGTLTLADPNSTWQIFPPHNGSIFVVQPANVCQYSYDLRDTSTANTIKLTNIQFINCINLAQGGTYIPPVPFFPASTATPYQYYIYIGKSLGIRSTSTYGN